MTPTTTDDRAGWRSTCSAWAADDRSRRDDRERRAALIQEDLGFSQSGLTWVVNAYLIPFGGLLLLSGGIGDLIGQRKMFLIGLAVFIAASLLCAVPRPGDADRRPLRRRAWVAR